MHPKAAEDIGETLYVIPATSMGLLCMCMYMVVTMMSGKLKEKNKIKIKPRRIFNISVMLMQAGLNRIANGDVGGRFV